MVASPGAARADVRNFVRELVGTAPVKVYVDAKGRLFRRFGVDRYPDRRFLSATGKSIGEPRGFAPHAPGY
jgi:hypothetical protein